jgi:sporulation integral membrane protein YlbJ
LEVILLSQFRPHFNAHARKLVPGLGILCAGAALLRWPQESMAAAREGLTLCATVILPSLFPFLVLSALVVELGMSQYLGRLLESIMVPLFRVNGSCACALALGLVGGYPVGARTAVSLYQNGQCSKTEAQRLLAFCNNCGPSFILGVVGAGIFGSSLAGLLLYLTHIAAAALVGLLFRFYRPEDRPRRVRGSWSVQATPFAAAFTRSVTGAMQSVLNICAFVLFFTVVIRVLSLSGILSALAGLLAALFSPLGLTQTWAQRLLTGLLELSSGVSTLSGTGGLTAKLTLAAFLLGWAGLSVHCQTLSFLTDSGLSTGTYFAGKLLHGILAAALTALAVRWLPWQTPVEACLGGQAETAASLDLRRGLSISTLCAAGVWLAFVGLCLYAVKKSSGKRRGNRV